MERGVHIIEMLLQADVISAQPGREFRTSMEHRTVVRVVVIIAINAITIIAVIIVVVIRTAAIVEELEPPGGGGEIEGVIPLHLMLLPYGSDHRHPCLIHRCMQQSPLSLSLSSSAAAARRQSLAGTTVIVLYSRRDSHFHGLSSVTVRVSVGGTRRGRVISVWIVWIAVLITVETIMGNKIGVEVVKIEIKA